MDDLYIGVYHIMLWVNVIHYSCQIWYCSQHTHMVGRFCSSWNYWDNIDFNNVDILSTNSPFILAVQVLSGLFWKTFIFPPNKWLNTTLFWWHFILIYSTKVYTIFSSSKMFAMVNQPAGALVLCTHICVLVWHF